MRQEPEHFGDQDLDLIYIAKRLREALKLENLLTASGFDYLVEPDTYKGGVMFHAQRVGAFFYVAPQMRQAACELLERNGYPPYAING